MPHPIDIRYHQSFLLTKFILLKIRYREKYTLLNIRPILAPTPVGPPRDDPEGPSNLSLGLQDLGLTGPDWSSSRSLTGSKSQVYPYPHFSVPTISYFGPKCGDWDQ